MKKIYSPLLEGLLALYLGFEWIQVTCCFLKKLLISHATDETYRLLEFKS